MEMSTTLYRLLKAFYKNNVMPPKKIQKICGKVNSTEYLSKLTSEHLICHEDVGIDPMDETQIMYTDNYIICDIPKVQSILQAYRTRRRPIIISIIALIFSGISLLCSILSLLRT